MVQIQKCVVICQIWPELSTYQTGRVFFQHPLWYIVFKYIYCQLVGGKRNLVGWECLVEYMLSHPNLTVVQVEAEHRNIVVYSYSRSFKIAFLDLTNQNILWGNICQRSVRKYGQSRLISMVSNPIFLLYFDLRGKTKFRVHKYVFLKFGV